MDATARYGHKRSHSQFEEDSIDRSVRQRRRGGFDRILPPDGAGSGTGAAVDDVVYRILCPGAKIGSVIGKGGSIIKALRGETGARIKVADAVPGCDERVIFISSSLRERREGKPGSRSGSKEKEYHNGGDTTMAAPPSSILPASQEALFKVFGRIVVDGEEVDEGDSSRNVTARLLVPSNQIGCLLGKGGKIIEQMRMDSGAQIRVLPREQLPKCAYHSDELVQLTGEVALVKKALLTISTRLYDNPPRDKPQSNQAAAFPDPALLPGALLPPGAFFPQANAAVAPGQISAAHLIGIAPAALGGALGGAAWPYGSPGLPLAPGLHAGGGRVKEEPSSIDGEFVVRLLCPNDKIGSVIGKGGMIIKTIREETCARIKIADPVAGAEERVILITSNESPHDQVSPALDAVLQLQSRIADPSPERDGTLTTRFLVPCSSIGCLLGKKGSIIADMRRNTRANIRVLSKESLPKCSHDDDELVQVVGDFNVSRDAVIEIITRLRANLFAEHIKIASSNPMQAPVHTYEPRHDPSPAGMFSLPGLGSQAIRSPIGTNPRNWGIQPCTAGLSALPFVGSTLATASFGAGRPGPGLVASVAGTTIEITIPAVVIGSIIGKGGSNISQIRQISGAKVKLHDPKPGSDKRIIEISGTPDQTQAAQSLLEAFMFTAQTQAAGFY